MKVVPLRLRPGDDLRLSLSGTLSPDGAHLHIAIANSTGAVIVELVIGLLPEWEFRREPDPDTGYAELEIHANQPISGS